MIMKKYQEAQIRGESTSALMHGRSTGNMLDIFNPKERWLKGWRPNGNLKFSIYVCARKTVALKPNDTPI